MNWLWTVLALLRWRASTSQVHVCCTTIHLEDCTWTRHAVKEKAPGETFWGELNYEWCQRFCYHLKDHRR